MIIHIVMLKFKKETPKDTILDIKEKIENLKQAIDVLNSIEVGLNFADEERAMDMVLTATFNSRADLEVYANNPTHLEVIQLIKEAAEFTKVVDYEK